MFIGHGLDQKGTYAYFIKPFLLFSSLKYFEWPVFKRLLKYPFSYFCIFRAVKILPFSDIDFSKDKKYKRELSEISIVYLNKMQKLCKKNSINLILASPPLKDEYREKIPHWTKFREQIKENGLEDLFTGYFNSLSFLNDSCFIDNCHLKHKYINMGNNLSTLRKMTLNQN